MLKNMLAGFSTQTAGNAIMWFRTHAYQQIFSVKLIYFNFLWCLVVMFSKK